MYATLRQSVDSTKKNISKCYLMTPGTASTLFHDQIRLK